MKTSFRIFLFFFGGSLILTSCTTNNHLALVKRHYRNGYYVDQRSAQTSTIARTVSPQDKELLPADRLASSSSSENINPPQSETFVVPCIPALPAKTDARLPAVKKQLQNTGTHSGNNVVLTANDEHLTRLTSSTTPPSIAVQKNVRESFSSRHGEHHHHHFFLALMLLIFLILLCIYVLGGFIIGVLYLLFILLLVLLLLSLLRVRRSRRN